MTVTGIPPSTDALTTVERVKQIGGKEDLSADQDQAIQLFINAISPLIQDYSGREFVARDDVTNVRRFELTTGRLVPWGSKGYDLRTVSSVVVNPTEGPTTLSASQYRLLPAYKPYGVWSYMRTAQPWDTWTPSGPGQIEITGTWGFPSVPDQVAMWAAVGVLEWLAKNQEVWSATFSLDTARLEIPEELPAAVARGLRRFRRSVVLPVG